MKMFLFNRKQKVKRWLVDKDFIEAKMTEQINAAAKLVFSVPLKKRLPATYFFAAIPQPRGSGYLLFKIVTEQVQSDRVQYTCIEAAYDELKSYHYIKDDRPQNRSAADMLQMALDGTRWIVGTAYDAGTGSTNFYYISSLEAIQKIADLFKLEVVFSISLDPNSHQITRRLVNLYAQQGERTGKRFEYGSNLLSVEREESSENLITALIGRGKGEEKYHTADGKPAEEDQTPDGYGRRINFADVVWSTDNGNPVNKPAGQEYVEDPDATAAYGFDDGKPRIGIEIFEDITDPGELLQATWSALQTLKRPKVSFKANTLDVGDLGLGDTVAIIRHDIKIEYFTRVYKVEHNLLNEKQNTIELGDDFNSQSITSAINSIASAVKQTNQTANYASVSANGKNTNNYGKDRPSNAVEGDLWYKDLGNGEVDLYQYHDGNWILITSTRDLHNVQKQVEKAQSEFDTAKNDIIANKQKADTDIENLNKSIEANKKTADESLQKLNDSVANLQGQYDNNIVPDLNKAAADAANALQKYIEAQKSIADLTKQAQQQGTDIANITSNVNGLSADFANLQGDVNSTKVDVKGIQATLGTATGDIAQLKLDAQSLQTMLAGKVDDSVYQNFVTLTNQALAAKLTASDLAGYAKTVDVQATANGLQLNIDSVNGRLNNLKIGGRNLIQNSGTDIVIESKTTDYYPQWKNKVVYYNLLPGKTYTFSVSATNTNDVEQASVRIYKDSFNGEYINKEATSWFFNADGERHSFTFTTPNDGIPYDIWLYAGPMGSVQGKDFATTYHHPQLEAGTVATDYRPAPEDVANDITQLSARITADSQQFSSYYTKSETDAKADAAKSDAVNAIKGDANWTGLTNIITNSSFLQSADGFIQKVQQTTLPMLGGGTNYATKTGELNVTGQNNTQNIVGYLSKDFLNQNAGKYLTISADVEWSGYQAPPAARGRIGVEVPIVYDDSTLWFGAWMGPTAANGRERISHTWQLPNSLVKADEPDTLAIWGYIQIACDTAKISNVKVELGTTATSWTPSPSDLATQVAFTELTQTVNGLQSTVTSNYGSLQTQISQTAAAIRSELSDQVTGVTNQITTTASGLNARIDGIKIGGRNYLQKSDKSISGWAQDLGTLPNEVLNSLAGETITVSVDVEWSNYAHSSEKQNRLGTEFSFTDSNGTTYYYGAWKDPTTPNGKERISTTYILPAGVTYTVNNNGGNGYVSIDGTGKVSHAKIEVGNRATDWTPAPEDTIEKFVEVNATINGLQSTVGSNYSALQSQINQTATTIRGEVTNSVSGLQTQITQQADNFNVSLNALRSETAWQKVTTAIDANNYTTTGNYWIQAAPNSNTPDGSAWAYLQVVAYSDVQRIKQTWQRDNNANEAYTRLKTGNTWSDWQKTVTAGNIMAQINMSAGTTLIQNNKIYMDADSTIFSGKAFIPSAAITDLSADKITTGTLNAGNVNIINMNADNIVAGTIKGTNLSIGLNSGEVEFQHGRIHNFDNTVDINLDRAYISTANNNILGATRALLKDGELQLTQPNIFDTNGDWYFRLFNGGGSGDAFAGGSLVGKNNVTVANKDNYQGATGLSASPVGEASFAGLFVGKGNSWMPTLLEGAERGVFIKGGKSISSEFMHGGPLMPGSPHISVGSDSSGANFWDNRIVIDAEYVHIPSAQRQTTGSSPNLFIADDGALVRSTSASKYKTDIQRSHSLDYGERLLSLPTATWIDKAESRRYASGESDMKPVTHFGMIAEDLAAAGLEMLVSRGQDGELEGIQYDRIAPALLPVIKKLQDRIKKLEERLNG